MMSGMCLKTFALLLSFALAALTSGKCIQWLNRNQRIAACQEFIPANGGVSTAYAKCIQRNDCELHAYGELNEYGFNQCFSTAHKECTKACSAKYWQYGLKLGNIDFDRCVFKLCLPKRCDIDCRSYQRHCRMPNTKAPSQRAGVLRGGTCDTNYCSLRGALCYFLCSKSHCCD